MKLLQESIYLTFEDAIECGISENTLWKASQRQSNSWQFIVDPTDKRKRLIEFETMKPCYKEMVQKRFGNPYEHVAKEPIRKMVIKDTQAEEFLLAYRFGENKFLPINIVNKYITAASWLKMLMNAEANKKEIKKQLGLTIAEFWNKVCEIIKSDDIDLPSTYQRLRQKVSDFQSNKFSSLIHKQFGNDNAKKVSSELAESILLEMLSRPHFDDSRICIHYNQWALQNEHDEISASTVSNWRRNNLHLIMGEKKGNKEWYNVFGKHIIRKRPSAPLLLVGSDDNDLDLYFQENRVNKKGHAIVNYYHRAKLIVVMDAYNDYILGYAYADEVSADLIRLAYLDAIHHVKDLTGNWHLQHQIQTDRWGKKTLDSFYKSIAKVYTPATARVARGKYIEQAFGKKWHQQLAYYPNYAGHNITAIAKTNADYIELHKKDFPSKDNAGLQIADFIDKMRNLKNENGVTRQQQWIDAFNQSEVSKELPINDEQMLLRYGTHHDYKNTITNRGITPSINCIDRTYEIPEEFYLQTVGKKIQVIYDPFDYSRILVTDNDKIRFIAREYDALPSAIADYKPGDRANLNRRISEKKRHVEQIANKKDQRQNLLQRNQIDSESLLQAGVLIKEIKQGAELMYQQTKRISNDTYDPLDQM